MALVKSVVVHSQRQPVNGRVKRRYTVVLTNNGGIDKTVITMPLIVLESDDGATIATKLLENEAALETNKKLDIVSQWSTQADYDRIALGKAMRLTNVHDFHATLPLFLAVETRGGANAIQRAAYLGVVIEKYNLMADRFGDDQGVAFFIDNAKAQIWDETQAEGWS
jgi:hypothetical protein